MTQKDRAARAALEVEVSCDFGEVRSVIHSGGELPWGWWHDPKMRHYVEASLGRATLTICVETESGDMVSHDPVSPSDVWQIDQQSMPEPLGHPAFIVLATAPSGVGVVVHRIIWPFAINMSFAFLLGLNERIATGEQFSGRCGTDMMVGNVDAARAWINARFNDSGIPDRRAMSRATAAFCDDCIDAINAHEFGMMDVLEMATTRSLEHLLGMRRSNGGPGPLTLSLGYLMHWVPRAMVQWDEREDDVDADVDDERFELAESMRDEINRDMTQFMAFGWLDCEDANLPAISSMQSC